MYIQLTVAVAQRKKQLHKYLQIFCRQINTATRKQLTSDGKVELRDARVGFIFRIFHFLLL